MNIYTTAQRIGLFLGPVLFIITLFTASSFNITPSAAKVAAITVLMTVWWITEAVPVAAASLMPVLLYPLLNIMNIKEVASKYTDPVVFLFIGGFFIAVTMERWNLHRRIALYTIKVIGKNPSKIIFGFMAGTAFISMWVSNTAAAMMMIPIGMAVVAQVTGIFSKQLLDGTAGIQKENFGKSLMLAIAYSASIGGIATLTGTPPNAIMAGMISSTYNQTITFFQWFILAFPLAVVMIIFTWVLLVKFLFPTGSLELSKGENIIEHELKSLGTISRQEIIVFTIFLLIAFLWIFTPLLKNIFPVLNGVSDAVIAVFGSILLFIIPADWKRGIFILDWRAASKIPWDIVLLFGGGFAVAAGFEKSGLADFITYSLGKFDNIHILLFVIIITLIVLFLTVIISNTAVAVLIIPIIAASSAALGIHPYAAVISACIASSFAFMLPISTPPNAIAFGSGAVRIKDMAKAGFILNIFGTIIIVIFVLYMMPVLWGIDLNTTPEWALKTADAAAGAAK